MLLHGIDLEQVVHALHHAGQTLQAHAGIDVLLLQARCSCRCRRCRTGRIRCSRPPCSGRSRSRRCSPACRSRTPRRGHSRSRSRGRTGPEPCSQKLSSLPKRKICARARCRSPCSRCRTPRRRPRRWTTYRRSAGMLQHLRCRNSHAQCDRFVLEVIAEGEVAQHLEDRCRGARSCRRSRYRRCGCTSGRW